MRKLKNTRCSFCAAWSFLRWLAMLNPAGVAVRAKSEAPTAAQHPHHSTGACIRR